MRVFMTGATGYVGGAVARTLVAAGHDVTALVRSEDARRKVEGAGLSAHRGDLRLTETYEDAARGHDVIVHAAYDYAPDTRGEQAEADRRAALALRRAASSADAGHLIYSSSAYLLETAGTAPVDESATSPSAASGDPRLSVERDVLDADGAGHAGAAVIRIGMVYGGTAGGTVPHLFRTAADAGHVRFAGSGRGRWSLVHVDDLAALYLAVVQERATGVFHGVDGTPLAVADVVSMVNRVAGTSGERSGRPPADEHTLELMHRDVAVVATRSRRLGWRPRFESFEQGVAAAYREWLAGRA